MTSLEKLDAVLFLLSEEFNRGRVKMSLREMFFALAARNRKLNYPELRLVIAHLSSRFYTALIPDTMNRRWNDVEYSITFNGMVFCEQRGFVEQEKRANSQKAQSDTIAKAVAVGTVAVVAWQILQFYLENHSWMGCCYCPK